ncbi:hypothetical protein [Serratia sp. CY85251]|uniref:hypothetical protein n=1 Tax=Serratia sp. CY85251 TaxID=3383696 RepID=UPI003F9ED5E5
MKHSIKCDRKGGKDFGCAADELRPQACYRSSHPLKLSHATFKRGINELEKALIIAKTLRKGRYFINPNFVFNGDRVAFTTMIERKKDDASVLPNPNQ